MSEKLRDKSVAENGAEKPEFLSFRQVAAAKNYPEINKYLASSAKTYEQHDINFQEIRVSEDLTKARLEFLVDQSMQGHEGNIHGGLTEYYVDSAAAALAWARVDSGLKPFTARSNIRYKAPCNVGGSYAVEIELVKKRGLLEYYKYSVTDLKDGIVCAEGEIDFFMKKIEHAK